MKFAVLILCLSLIAGCQTAARHEDTSKQDKSAEVHFKLGIDAMNKNNMPKAFDELLQAERLAPARADILDALGIAWIKRGNLDKAEKSYRRAMQLSPPASTYNNYGGLLLQQGHPKKAEQMFRKALEDPRYRNPDIAYINLGDALLAQKKFDEAIASYKQARQLNPRQELSRLKEAQAFEQSNRKHYAKALYEAILRERPGNQQAMQGLLSMLRNEGNLTEARSKLREFSRHTDNPDHTAWAKDQLYKLSRP